ncbi:MAG: SCO family protein [bacterium]|nr:SCO family protein [bacterium]
MMPRSAGMVAAVAVLAVVAAQLALLMVVHLQRGTAFRPFAGEPIVPGRLVPQLHLIDDRGRPFTLTPENGGRPTVYYFGYTRCTDACPLTLARLARARREMGALDVRFVTLDPAHDDPPRLHRYLARFDARFTGLTGTPAEIAAAQRAFGVSAAANGSSLDHDDAVIVVDPAGRMALRYTGADLDVGAFVDDVRRL